jgi:hypothetical protein
MLSILALLAATPTAQTDPPPSLVGTWAQDEKTCLRSTIREVVFRKDGSFDVTWYPFERYVDYWGNYALDSATGDLTITPTGGNAIPSDAATTRKVIAFDGADSFQFVDGSLGISPTFGSCTGAFRRLGPVKEPAPAPTE